MRRGRRGFLIAGSVLLAASLARGQISRRIVILSPFHETPATEEEFLRGFREGLTAEGLNDGSDYILELAPVQVGERLADGVREALRRQATLLVPLTTLVAQATAREARGVPVLFGIVSDPIASGLVASLARPGGNVTGVSNMLPELSGKLLELLLEVIPRTSRVAVLFNPDNPAKLLEVRDLRVATKARGVLLRELPVRSGQDIDLALNAVSKDPAHALVILGEALTHNYAQHIDETTLKIRLPVVSNDPTHAEALASYAPDYAAHNRRLGALAGKVLKGAKPSQLPVELPTKFQLVINQKSARKLGITVPPSILLRADRVIEW